MRARQTQNSCPSKTRPADAAARRVERARQVWAPSAASIGVVIAVLLMIMATARHLMVEHDLALAAAATEVDIRATLLAERLNAALAAAPQVSPAEVFRRVLESGSEEWLARAVLVDRVGRRIADDPLKTAGGGAMEPVPPPSPAEERGVVRISDDAAGDRFTTVRALPATSWRVAFASPVERHLAAWRRATTVTVLLLVSTVGLAGAVGGLRAFGARAIRRRRGVERAVRARTRSCAEPRALRPLDLGAA